MKSIFRRALAGLASAALLFGAVSPAFAGQMTVPGGFAYANGTAVPVAPDFSAFTGAAKSISFSTATTVQVAAPVTGASTYVTALSLSAAGTTTVQLVYGTQTTNPCDTGQVVMTGLMSLGTAGNVSIGNGAGVLLSAPAGKQLCLVQTGTVQLSGFVTFVQF